MWQMEEWLASGRIEFNEEDKGGGVGEFVGVEL